MKSMVGFTLVCLHALRPGVTADVLLVSTGDNVTLHCDLMLEKTMWFSHLPNQSPTLISVTKIPSTAVNIFYNSSYKPRISPVWQPANNTIGLEIRNISRDDVKHSYYCGALRDVDMVFGTAFTLTIAGEKAGKKAEAPIFPLFFLFLPNGLILFALNIGFFCCIRRPFKC